MGREAGTFTVLGVRVHAAQIPDVIAQVERWIAAGRRGEGDSGGRFIAVTGMHGVTVAQEDLEFKRILNEADLVVADGMPLVWLGRRAGFPLWERVCGPDFMRAFLEQTGEKYRHFLYGGGPGVAERLADVLTRQHKAKVVGTYCPPFRTLTPEEEAEVMRVIHGANPDVVWVGLSTPKQERWMYEHGRKLRVPVLIGVGAAFDFLAGLKPRAPRWMREHGLEWLFRLLTEPRRLWRRYLLGGSKFAYWVLLEQLGLRRGYR